MRQVSVSLPVKVLFRVIIILHFLQEPVVRASALRCALCPSCGAPGTASLPHCVLIWNPTKTKLGVFFVTYSPSLHLCSGVCLNPLPFASWVAYLLSGQSIPFNFHSSCSLQDRKIAFAMGAGACTQHTSDLLKSPPWPLPLFVHGAGADLLSTVCLQILCSDSAFPEGGNVGTRGEVHLLNL